MRRVYLDPGKARFLRKRGSSREPPHDRRTDASPEQILLQRRAAVALARRGRLTLRNTQTSESTIRRSAEWLQWPMNCRIRATRITPRELNVAIRQSGLGRTLSDEGLFGLAAKISVQKRNNGG
jgi:hypothetical protein